MFKFQKAKCTEEITGTLVKKRWNGEVWFITVEYEVEGVKYKVTEQLTYKITNVYKVGKIPFGTHSTSAIENIDVGANVKIKYNPNKPKQSYLPENNGKHTV